jgi:predicted RNA binding protein YcfA (HicA-like mRNA interferase family)
MRKKAAMAATGKVLKALLLLGWWVVRLRGAMHVDTEKAVTALMTVAIAGVGPACIGLMLLL